MLLGGLRPSLKSKEQFATLHPMSLKQFFMGRAVVFLLALILGLGFFAYTAYAPATITGSQLSGFMWEYKSAATLNPDGIPETEVYLVATYANGKKETKLIDTIPSSCNDLPDAEEGSVNGTKNIQCYGAGLGFKFKITKGESSYQVQRQMFEEASSDYNPPRYDYVVVAEFPLSVAN